jgi:hypothetical protein
MRMGRYGSIAVRLPTHVPPIPRANNTSGPTQHTDAPMAATTPAMSEPFPVMCAMPISFNLFAQVIL